LVYRTAIGKLNTWKIPADGAGAPVQVSSKFSRVPVVSPDGKVAAYFYRDENAPWRLAVAPFDGGEPIKTFDVPAFHDPSLRWTPDGRALAYVDTRGGVSNIVAQPLDGGKPAPITDFKTDLIFTFDFSRDGKQIALSRGTDYSDLVLIENAK
jgi:Tol biopolymer transport system component